MTEDQKEAVMTLALNAAKTVQFNLLATTGPRWALVVYDLATGRTYVRGTYKSHVQATRYINTYYTTDGQEFDRTPRFLILVTPVTTNRRR